MYFNILSSFCEYCLHGEFAQLSQAGRMLLFLDFSLLFSLPPEGLKKVRNPDRMYRSAVCYAGHGPPKSISDDTETNSKSQLLILHCCSKRPLAGPIYYSFIDSFIYFLISSVPPCPLPPFFILLQHNTSSGCFVDWSVCFTGSRCQ